MKASRATKLVLAVFLASAALIGLGTLAARAQSNTYVSSTGSDANDCTTPSTACATFTSAHSKVNDGGSISCVNPAFYGHLVITKSVTIDCQAGGGANDIEQLSIDAPGRNIRLRDIAVNGQGLTPVVFIGAAASVHLENVFVTGASNIGIYDHRTGPAKLFISDSSILANTGPGIVIAPTGGTVIGAVLDNVRLRDNNYGIAVGNGGRVAINRSVFSGNVTAGIESDPGGVVEVEETLISFNGTGVLANNGSSVAISNSRIISNSTAVSGPTTSFGNNRFFANSSNGTAPTPAGAQSHDLGQK